jgi:hypothetical protein
MSLEIAVKNALIIGKELAITISGKNNLLFMLVSNIGENGPLKVEYDKTDKIDFAAIKSSLGGSVSAASRALESATELTLTSHDSRVVLLKEIFELSVTQGKCFIKFLDDEEIDHQLVVTFLRLRDQIEKKIVELWESLDSV